MSSRGLIREGFGQQNNLIISDDLGRVLAQIPIVVQELAEVVHCLLFVNAGVSGGPLEVVLITVKVPLDEQRFHTLRVTEFL